MTIGNSSAMLPHGGLSAKHARISMVDNVRRIKTQGNRRGEHGSYVCPSAR